VDRVSRPLVIAASLILAALLIGGGALLLADRPSESTAEGIVVQVTSSGTLAVASFQLRTEDGRTLTFTLGDLDLSPPGFNGPHLFVHRATLQPIVVRYRTDGSAFVAVRLVDAPVPSPSIDGAVRQGVVTVASAVERS
jgi:hypothetical protein